LLVFDPIVNRKSMGYSSNQVLQRTQLSRYPLFKDQQATRKYSWGTRACQGNPLQSSNPVSI